MARKIGKNSRNARQADGAYDDPSVDDLKDLPRAEKTDLSNILIRTQAKNEALLDAKINKKRKGINKVNKKTLQDKINKSVNGFDKERLERALNISNVLDGKISKSISRAKYVQSTRKAGWDLTNEIIRDNIKQNVDSMNKVDKNKKNKDDLDLMEEPLTDDEEEQETIDSKNAKMNPFDVLPTEDDE